jgi:hypothetical protein
VDRGFRFQFCSLRDSSEFAVIAVFDSTTREGIQLLAWWETGAVLLATEVLKSHLSFDLWDSSFISRGFSNLFDEFYVPEGQWG